MGEGGKHILIFMYTVSSSEENSIIKKRRSTDEEVFCLPVSFALLLFHLVVNTIDTLTCLKSISVSVSVQFVKKTNIFRD